ncbi:hypothetical protein K435DRAFT_879192 [Dendrothele bispora CBS 962.96]|uniref:Uncharacterized protein n=1 Tax=Dendrothele bispora (strain CBS 962.96) TaxID=1314807 RepID=A0A4S8KLR3_DENBC|nr:hypothetical protein K435DRAFT_879192 [Dendrothele bispora CBS 962.96]
MKPINYKNLLQLLQNEQHAILAPQPLHRGVLLPPPLAPTPPPTPVLPSPPPQTHPPQTVQVKEQSSSSQKC